MKDNKYMLNIILTLVLGVILLVMVIVRMVFPVVILPKADIPNLVLVSLIALVLDHYLAPGAKRCYICIPLFSAVTFGLLTFVSAYASLGEAAKLAIIGGIVFTATTWVFTAIQERLSSGPAAKASGFFSAVSLYMAVQCFVGIFL